MHLFVDKNEVWTFWQRNVSVTKMSRLALYRDMIAAYRESYGARKRVSSVSVVTRLLAGRPRNSGSILFRWQEIFISISKCLDQLWVLQSVLLNGATISLPSGQVSVVWIRHIRSCAKIKNAWSWISSLSLLLLLFNNYPFLAIFQLVSSRGLDCQATSSKNGFAKCGSCRQLTECFTPWCYTHCI